MNQLRYIGKGITRSQVNAPLVPQEPGPDPTGNNFMKLGGNDLDDDDFLNLIFNVSVNGDPGEPPRDMWDAINDDKEGKL